LSFEYDYAFLSTPVSLPNEECMVQTEASKLSIHDFSELLLGAEARWGAQKHMNEQLGSC
jgi:hypothetical protein